MPAPQRTALRVRPPFELRLTLFGHGWIALAPHRYDEARDRWQTVLRLGRTIVDATVAQVADDELRLTLARSRARPLTRDELADARAQVAKMLRLDCDLGPFHARCERDPRRRWVGRRGGGRLLRSPTVFEDLMKLLFTTNTSWAATEAMTQNLVDALGERAPSGARAFPTAQRCVQDEAFYRDIVRCGYRARAARELAAAFVDGRLDDATFDAAPSSDELWRRLSGLHGFGPYAAGQAMRLCGAGHYDRLALDSWCRARLAELDGTKGPPSDAQVARRYAPFAPFEGLALWCDLTAEWHGEGGAT